MSSLPQKRLVPRETQRGFTLVLVLAFVVLLVGVTLAFFSNALAQHQVSSASANQVKTTLFADGAADTLIGDLKAEIVAGSINIPITTGGVTTHIYAPRSNTGQTYAQNSGAYTTMLPATQGFTRATYTPGTPDPLANLVKVSVKGAPFYPGGGGYTAAGPTRAAASPTNTGDRPISLGRWNKPLFLQAKDTTNLAPTAAGFPVPDWIYVARDGSNKTALDPQVLGRYAYAIYDEGALLDINVAGYPGSMTPTAALPDVVYKNALVYADLTQIGLPQTQIDEIIGWRNAASSATTDKYKKFAAFNQSGFLKTVNENLVAGRSDCVFSSRQQLISFFKDKVPGFTKATQDTLQYLTTFSRGLDQPSYIRLQSTNPGKATKDMDFNAAAPKVLAPASGGNSYGGKNLDDKVNPSFLGVRVQTTFTRNDGMAAVVGEPLVKKRFALNRLAWLTYKGPSHDRSQGDPDIQALIKYGIPWSYLQNGTTENIRKYFGLSWDGSKWKYDQQAKSGATGAILTLEEIAALGTKREPNFFELLKAAINVGSLGKSTVPDWYPSRNGVSADPGANQADQPFNYNAYADVSVDFQILQIGANIISQFQPSNYPPRIVYDDGGGLVYSNRTIVGVANLPYFYGVIAGILQLKPATTNPPNTLPNGTQTYPTTPATTITGEGVGALMETPIIWNPHDPFSPTTNAPGLSPTAIRVVAYSAPPDDLTNPQPFITYAGAIPSGTGIIPSDWLSYNARPGTATWYRGGISNLVQHTFDALNTAITLNITAPTANPTTLFPEPTLLFRPKTFSDNNGNSIAVSIDPSQNWMAKNAQTSPFFGGGGLKSAYRNEAYIISSKSGPAGIDPANQTPYIGFFMGAFPMAWTAHDSGLNKDVAVHASKNGCFLARPTGSTAACYMTYCMQYQDPSGGWVTYDTKYGKITDTADDPSLTYAGTSFRTMADDGMQGSLIGGWKGVFGSWGLVTDPRTSRFGLLNSMTSGKASMNGGVLASPIPGPEFENWIGTGPSSPGPYATGWLDANGIAYSGRPDSETGFYFSNFIQAPNTNGLINRGWPQSLTGPTANKNTGWMAHTGSDNSTCYSTGIAPGLLSQNNTDIVYSGHKYFGSANGNSYFPPNYFADPDGMVRRGMGAFVGSGTASSPTSNSNGGYVGVPVVETTVGLPMARVYDWNTANIFKPSSPIPTITGITAASHGTTIKLSQAQSRPYFLHRPFYSVAELGYVFSDTPWRNLDFSTAESGNTALLDVFCINDSDDTEGLVAGKVNLNTRQVPVLQAILAGAYIDPVQPTSANALAQIQGDVAANLTARRLAVALVTRTQTVDPLRNVAELVGKWKTNRAIPAIATPQVSEPPLPSPYFDGKRSYTGFSGGDWPAGVSSGVRKPQVTSPAVDVYSVYVADPKFPSNSKLNGEREAMTNIQRFREAPIRALAGVGQTRVWNLMIDVIAQSGHFPTGATGLEKFAVDGEQRLWVHVAIDRFTGKVIDKQIEVVRE